MMKINVVTIFPDMIKDFLKQGLVKRHIENGGIEINAINLREWGIGNYKQVDDYVFGTGKSILMRYDVLSKCLDDIGKGHLIITTPAGEKYDQKKALELSEKDVITIVCGRYEGFDGRIENEADDLISVGDYVLNGGETAAMIMIESITRLLKGFTKEENIKNDSHSTGLLECQHFTRPATYNGKSVPDEVLSGNHAEIEKFNRKNSLVRTLKNRPDMFSNIKLKKEDVSLLTDHIHE
ncbi:MAG: tRNA (guanosine(37)-N1)-methyltransferase TrmD [Candidatus Muiribacterium halophilum]|uniref:tRNA (guanine-N(1)-)-methyltransferase n=1 Tax=Muiribacterium halophilum TaxID=2053465 RepID=A0A2N5ZIU4_MUIH1|nr:MAG: tRNA (guanosine(37)-N1)-methyltransferase TrmD [Candidatus Muirbacterium halophilum]